MITARELKEKREKYKTTIEGELQRIEKVLGYYNPETEEYITCQLFAKTLYEVKKNLEDRGFSINLVQGYGNQTIDEAIRDSVSSYITVIINF